MIRSFHDRYGRNRWLSLCFVFIFVFAVCGVYEKPEPDLFSSAGSGNLGSIVSPENDTYDDAANESTGCSVLKYISSGSSASRRIAGSRAGSVYAVVNKLFILTGLFVVFHIYFYRSVLTSHRIIIDYIHNLDGMKP